MFTILNRLRGTWSWVAKLTGVIFGLAVFIVTSDVLVAGASAIMYVIGESFGWGKWIGGLYRGNKIPTDYQLKDLEGRYNGIHWLANKLIPETKDYYNYCFLALTFRGMLWFGLTLLPLLIGEYISILLYIDAVVLLGVGFPLSILLGKFTEKKFSFKFMENFWAQAEVWYGIIQDFVILLLLFGLVT